MTVSVGAVGDNEFGFHFDEVRKRLDVYYAGTRIATYTTAGFSLESGAITDDVIQSGSFAPLSIETADIAALAITNAKISNAANIVRSKFAQEDLAVFEIPIRNWMAEDGAVLGIAEEAGTFFVQDGTNQMYLQGEVANNETEVSVMKTSFMLPHNYVDGQTINIRAAVDVTGAGTLGTCTVDFSAYKQDISGAIGSDLVSTSATAVDATAANADFVVTPTGLVSGDLLSIVCTTSIQETASTAIQAIITRTAMLLDIKG